MDEARVERARRRSRSQPLLARDRRAQGHGRRAAHDRRAARAEHRRARSASAAIARQPRAQRRSSPTSTRRGLGLPDRDYYLKPEPRFAEAREKYRAHMRRHVPAGRRHETAGQGRRRAGLRAWRRRWPRPRSTTSALRDPKATDHKMTFAELQKLAPRFDWAAYFDAAGIAAGATSTCASRSSCRSSTGSWRETPLADLEDVPRLAPAELGGARRSPTPFVEENFALLRAPTWAGRRR